MLEWFVLNAVNRGYSISKLDLQHTRILTARLINRGSRHIGHICHLSSYYNHHSPTWRRNRPDKVEVLPCNAADSTEAPYSFMFLFNNRSTAVFLLRGFSRFTNSTPWSLGFRFLPGIRQFEAGTVEFLENGVHHSTIMPLGR